MKRHLFAIVLAIAGFFAIPAAATPIVLTYKLDNVTFLDGGTASGSFTAVFDTLSWSNTFSQLLAVDITTTPGSALAGTHYTNLNNWGAGLAGPSPPFGQSSPYVWISFLELSTPDQENLLFLGYDQTIPITPTTTLQLLATNQIPGGEWHLGTWRAWGSGSLLPVTIPEPTTWMIFLAGIGLAYAVLWWRRATARI